MSLGNIDVFVAVVNAQGFSNAARQLGMPTTTVSAQIARLEERLGVTLLQRTTRKLSLTAAGETYYQHCVRALEEMNTAQSKLEQSKLAPEGTLRITAPADLCQTVLVPVIEKYLDRYPKVSLDLVISNDFRDLVGEKIDLGLRIGKLSDSTLIMRRFISSHLGLWASSAYVKKFGIPATVRALSKHHMLWLTLVKADIELYDAKGKRVNIANNSRFTIDDMQTYLSYIEAGMGIGLLPDFTQRAKKNTKQKLIRILPKLNSKPISVYFVYPQQIFVPPNVRCFMETALELEQDFSPARI